MGTGRGFRGPALRCSPCGECRKEPCAFDRRYLACPLRFVRFMNSMSALLSAPMIVTLLVAACSSSGSGGGVVDGGAATGGTGAGGTGGVSVGTGGVGIGTGGKPQLDASLGGSPGRGGATGGFGGTGGSGATSGSGGTGGGSSCAPAFCPSVGVGTPCCQANGECGVDMGFGAGCEPPTGADV